MKGYFIELKWIDESTPLFHLKNADNNIDEFIYIPSKLFMENLNKKTCVGTTNPYTQEYFSCNHSVENNEHQCNNCKYMFDFYKCVRCHGDYCSVKNKDALKYCNTPHYVYIAYFANDKIKVGTASEFRKYDRLIGQGAIFSIFIAKTSTGKVARQIEKCIIDNGISGLVTTIYKMKNLTFNNSNLLIKKVLLNKYEEIMHYIPSQYIKYMINPEFNYFSVIKEKIDENIYIEDEQLTFFPKKSEQKKCIIKKDYEIINGKYLFSIGKILAIENNGIVELIDTKKIEGYLFDFKVISEIKYYDKGSHVKRR